MRLLRFLFEVRTPVQRLPYALAGASLMALKFALDALIVRAGIHRTWTPLSYLKPLAQGRMAPDAALTTAALVMLVTLPFLWTGLALTRRRARDAGLPSWVALLFLAPFLNYLVMAALCLLPSAKRGAGEEPNEPPDGWHGALVGLASGVVYGLVMSLLSIHVFKRYGSALFLGTPAAMGAMSAYFLNRARARSLRATFASAALSVVVGGAVLMLFALEGAVCVAMVLPIAVAWSLVGALFGRAVARLHDTGTLPPAAASLLLLVLPFLAGFESRPAPLPLLEVASLVEIDAPPERVWPHVVGFSELPPEREWTFGIATPRRARIEGSGVGAVRYCEFSTGPFVEPITRWEPPRRLSFDVASQPPPMKEWSPYRGVQPPHLDGYLRSRRGEFRLVPLAGGRTRLEGSTWYTLDLAPNFYWKLWSDALIGTIHHRVLAHVKALSEQ